jgi:hypothetical protein
MTPTHGSMISRGRSRYLGNSSYYLNYATGPALSQDILFFLLFSPFVFHFQSFIFNVQPSNARSLETLNACFHWIIEKLVSQSIEKDYF